MSRFLLFCSLFISFYSMAQQPCEYKLKQDTATLLLPKTKENVEIISIKIKNNYLVQFIKQDKKNYMKIIVRDNLGFGKKGSLLLLSAKKQIFVKTITLQIIDKESAYFLVDLNNNFYLENIKEFGMNKIVFNETTEFSIPKQDSDQIKKAAECFFDIVKDSIWPPVKKL